MARHVHVHLHPTKDAGWEESKHPRDGDGKFGSGSKGKVSEGTLSPRQAALREMGSPRYAGRHDGPVSMGAKWQTGSDKPAQGFKIPPKPGTAPAAQHMTHQEHARQAAIHRTNWNKYKAQRARVKSGTPEAKELDAKMKAEHTAMVMHTQRGNAKRPTGAN